MTDARTELEAAKHAEEELRVELTAKYGPGFYLPRRLPDADRARWREVLNRSNNAHIRAGEGFCV